MTDVVTGAVVERSTGPSHADGPPGAAPHGPPPVPTFSIVPLRGLPIVAVTLVALIVAIATNKLWALDFFHVVGGGLWTGSTCSSG